MSTLPIEVRYCAHCGLELVRKRRPNGKLESLSEFALRRYCGHACANALGVGARRVVPFPVSDRLTVAAAYRLASEQCPGACPIECGFIGYLADNECEHGRLPTDGGDPCGCWGEVIEAHEEAA